MQFKIDDIGVLAIKRDRGWVIADCAKRRGIYCSDRCPLFGEIEREGSFEYLELCDGKTLARKVDEA